MPFNIKSFTQNLFLLLEVLYLLDIFLDIMIFSLEQIMVNKCAALSCRSGFAKNETKYITKFLFLLKNFELNALSIRFVTHKNWKPKKTLLLYDLHFQEECIVRGKSNLKCSMNPIPKNIPKSC